MIRGRLCRLVSVGTVYQRSLTMTHPHQWNCPALHFRSQLFHSNVRHLSAPQMQNAMSKSLIQLYTTYCKQHNLAVESGVSVGPLVQFLESSLALPDALTALRSDVNFVFPTKDVVMLQQRVAPLPFLDVMVGLAASMPLEGCNIGDLEAMVTSMIPDFQPRVFGEDVTTKQQALEKYDSVWCYVTGKGTFVPIAQNLVALVTKGVLNPKDGTPWDVFADHVEQCLPGWLQRVSVKEIAELSKYNICVERKSQDSLVYGVNWSELLKNVHHDLPVGGVSKQEFFEKIQTQFPSFAIEMLHGLSIRQFLSAYHSTLFHIEKSEHGGAIGDFTISPKDLNGLRSFDRDVTIALRQVHDTHNELSTAWVDFEEVLPHLPRGAQLAGPQHYNSDNGGWLRLLEDSTNLEYCIKIIVREKVSRLSSVVVFVDGENITPDEVGKIIARLEITDSALKKLVVVRPASAKPHSSEDILCTPWLDTYMAVEAQASLLLPKDTSINSVVFICDEEMKSTYEEVSLVASTVLPSVRSVVVSTPLQDIRKIWKQ
eukprot:PhF_6_TR36012/c0_g1_i2/m.52193